MTLFWLVLALVLVCAVGPHLWALATYQAPRIYRALRRRSEPAFTATPVVVAAVLEHLRDCKTGGAAATGMHPLTDSQWRICIHLLRLRGHTIREVAGGDRATNKHGYVLVRDIGDTDETTVSS